jgi:hypothetical protein
MKLTEPGPDGRRGTSPYGNDSFSVLSKTALNGAVPVPTSKMGVAEIGMGLE